MPDDGPEMPSLPDDTHPAIRSRRYLGRVQMPKMGSSRDGLQIPRHDGQGSHQENKINQNQAMNLLQTKDLKKLKEIQSKVIAHYGLPPDAMTTPVRTNNIAHPRMLAMFLCCRNTDLTLSEIGRHFGNRDHGTVIHARKKIMEAVRNNPKIKTVIDEILND